MEEGGDGPGYRACKKMPGSPVIRGDLRISLVKGCASAIEEIESVERDGTLLLLPSVNRGRKL